MPSKIVVRVSIWEGSLFVLLIVVIFGNGHASLWVNFIVEAVIIELQDGVSRVFRFLRCRVLEFCEVFSP